MENVIEINNLNYSFDKQNPVLKNIHLHVPKGCIYGFIGANGAGKSTTIRLLMGLLNDDERKVKIFGQNASDIYPQALQRIGSLIDYPAFYDHLSGYNNLKIVCMIRGLEKPKIDEALEVVGLSHAKSMKMKKYSLGMKQRLAIAIALISQPELLVLDEPVNGLDPNGMIEMRQLFMRLNKEHGITIFISSHLLQEIDKMSTYLGVISHGEMKFEGSRKELNNLYSIQKTKFSLPDAQKFLPLVPHSELRSETELSVVTNSSNEIAQINQTLVYNGAQVFQIAPAEGLEEWFLEITK